MDQDWAKTIIIGVAVVALLVAGMVAKVYFGIHTTANHITVLNHADELISDARLKYDDRELALGAIDRGGRQSADFIISHEGSVTLTVQFSSGRSVSADNVGYVTPGMPMTLIFHVTDDKVLLAASLSRAPHTK